MADFLSSFNKLAPFTNEVAEDLQKTCKQNHLTKENYYLKAEVYAGNCFLLIKGL